MNKTLGEYFNGISDILAARSKLGGDSAENADIGANREVIISNFLEKHIPKRFIINRGGDIFGIGGARSGQIDIVVNHDMSMNFTENHKLRCPVESVTAAISVKSTLNKNEIKSALKNLATIPQCDQSVISLNPLKPKIDEYLLSWPTLFVFAYDGVDVATCVEHVNNFYKENTVPLNRIPRGIIVNGKYHLAFRQYEISGASIHSKFNLVNLQCGNITQENRGSPLFFMMLELSKGLSWFDGLYLDYGSYYKEAYS